MTTAVPLEAAESGPMRQFSSTSEILAAARERFPSLAILNAVIWGGFTALAAGTSAVMIRWDIIGMMIEWDRLSGAVQTREEWSDLQGRIAAYFWSGYMFSGGWTVGVLYVIFLSLIFAGCWAAVHMTAIRIMAAPRKITAFEGFVLATPRLTAGVLPYLLWVMAIFGLVGYRLVPKLLNTRNDYGSWRILDILGSLPLAIGASLIIAFAWIFLLHQATLGDRPLRAWFTCVPLVWKSPGASIGRWVGNILLVALGAVAIAYAGYLILSSVTLYPYTLGLITSALIVIVLSGTTWVTLALLPLWQSNSRISPKAAGAAAAFAVSPQDGVSVFHEESAEWESQDQGAAIYVPDTSGGVVLLEDPLGVQVPGHGQDGDAPGSEDSKALPEGNSSPAVDEETQQPGTATNPMDSAEPPSTTQDADPEPALSNDLLEVAMQEAEAFAPPDKPGMVAPLDEAKQAVTNSPEIADAPPLISHPNSDEKSPETPYPPAESAGPEEAPVQAPTLSRRTPPRLRRAK